MRLGFSESAAGCWGRTEQPRRKKGVCIQVSRLVRKARRSADGQYLVLLTEAKRLILLGNAQGEAVWLTTHLQQFLMGRKFTEGCPTSSFLPSSFHPPSNSLLFFYTLFGAPYCLLIQLRLPEHWPCAVHSSRLVGVGVGWAQRWGGTSWLTGGIFNHTPQP